MILGTAALLLSSAAALLDARTGRIPNALTLLALAAGLLLPWGSPAGALACAALPLALFARGKMAGGDVKLLAGLGALLGARRGLAVEGLAVAGALLAGRQRLGPWVFMGVLLVAAADWLVSR